MNLMELKPRLDEYVKFAKQYPVAMRPAIVSFLLTENSRDGRQIAAEPVTRSAAPDAPVAITAAAIADGPSTPARFNPADAWGRMAADLGVAESDVRRAIQYDDAGRPEIRLRIEEDTMARRQLVYSVIYIYAVEQAGGESANSKELRELCVQKRAFNSPNFTRNFKMSPWVKGYGSPGKRDQDWLLTQAGRAEAKALLRRLLGADTRPEAVSDTRSDEPSAGGSEMAAD